MLNLTQTAESHEPAQGIYYLLCTPYISQFLRSRKSLKRCSRCSRYMYAVAPYCSTHNTAHLASRGDETKVPMTTQNPNTSIRVNGLNYKFQDGTVGLNDVTFDLPVGSRTLLIGGKLSSKLQTFCVPGIPSSRFLTFYCSKWCREVNSPATDLWQAACPDRRSPGWGA